MIIANLKDAMQHFENNLKENVIRRDLYQYHAMFRTSRNKYFITFKRDYYKSFQYHFNNNDGWGQISNKELVQKCIQEEAIFVMVMPDSKIYYIDPVEFMDYYKKNKTDVPHLEGEIACPLKMFSRFTGEVEVKT